MKLVLFTGYAGAGKTTAALDLRYRIKNSVGLPFVQVLSVSWYLKKMDRDLFGYDDNEKPKMRKGLVRLARHIRAIDRDCLTRATAQQFKVPIYKTTVIIYDDIRFQHEVDFLRDFYDTEPAIIRMLGGDETERPNECDKIEHDFQIAEHGRFSGIRSITRGIK